MIDFDKGKNGPQAAIRLKCLECCGGTLRDVWACESTACPLWTWRPRQGEQLSFIIEGEKKGATA